MSRQLLLTQACFLSTWPKTQVHSKLRFSSKLRVFLLKLRVKFLKTQVSGKAEDIQFSGPKKHTLFSAIFLQIGTLDFIFV